jgi:hypothetical protein
MWQSQTEWLDVEEAIYVRARSDIDCREIGTEGKRGIVDPGTGGEQLERTFLNYSTTAAPRM